MAKSVTASAKSADTESKSKELVLYIGSYQPYLTRVTSGELFVYKLPKEDAERIKASATAPKKRGITRGQTVPPGFTMVGHISTFSNKEAPNLYDIIEGAEMTKLSYAPLKIRAD